MSDLKRFIVEVGDWEIELRPNGGYDTLVDNRLQKHGTHDQSTHNPWKGGSRGGAVDPMRGYKAGEWTQITDPAQARKLYKEQSAAAYEQREGKPLAGRDKDTYEDVLNRDSVVAVRERELRGAEVWQNGSTLLIVKRYREGVLTPDPKGQVSDVEIRGILAETDRMQRDYPVAGLRVHIDDQAFDNFSKDRRVAAFAYRGGASSATEPHIFIRTKTMRGYDVGQFDKSTYFKPAGEVLNNRRYTLTHEWGHLIDTKGGMPFELKDMKIKEVIDRVGGGFALQTAYGSTEPAEHFAESFASFAIHKQKGWKMTNPLTLEMAKEFKW